MSQWQVGVCGKGGLDEGGSGLVGRVKEHKKKRKRKTKRESERGKYGGHEAEGQCHLTFRLPPPPPDL